MAYLFAYLQKHNLIISAYLSVSFLLSIENLKMKNDGKSLLLSSAPFQCQQMPL